MTRMSTPYKPFLLPAMPKWRIHGTIPAQLSRLNFFDEDDEDGNSAPRDAEVQKQTQMEITAMPQQPSLAAASVCRCPGGNLSATRKGSPPVHVSSLCPWCRRRDRFYTIRRYYITWTRKRCREIRSSLAKILDLQMSYFHCQIKLHLFHQVL